MSEVNKSDAVTVKVPRNALIGGGAIALVGLGLAAGMMLRSPSTTAPATVADAASGAPSLMQPASQAAEVPAATALAPNAQNTPAAEPVKTAAAPHKRKHETTHQETASRDEREQTRAPEVAAAQPAICATCGVIESVRAVQQKGQGSGAGAVAGGLLGGVVGNQMGKGNGKTAMTVLGAIGGGFAGNEVEKQTRTVTVYEVHVRMDDGSTRTFTQRSEPTPGTRVEVDGQGFHTLDGR